MSADEMTAWLRKVIEGDKARAEGMAAFLGAEWGTRRNDSDGFDYTVYGNDPDEPVADTWRVDVASWLADNDPCTIIADCEAKLALLDRYDMAVARGDLSYDYLTGCQSRAEILWKALLVLTGAYRHREGWRDKWPVPEQFQ